MKNSETVPFAFWFAALMALGAFVPAWLVALVWPGLSIGGRAVLAIVPPSLTFLTLLLLCVREFWRPSLRRWRVARAWRSRPETTDDAFAGPFPDDDRPTALDVRKGLARFCHIPETRLHPDDRLDDLGLLDVMPELYQEISREVSRRCGRTTIVGFPRVNLRTVGDLVEDVAIKLRATAFSPLPLAQDDRAEPIAEEISRSYDAGRIDEAVLALLYLRLLKESENQTVGTDQDPQVLLRLRERGYLRDGDGRDGSWAFTESGKARARDVCQALFGFTAHALEEKQTD